jgi:flagellar biosynthetic protein FliR
MLILTEILEHPDYLFLLFLRVSSLLIGSPIFGRKNVPSMVKVGFCLMLTAVFLTALPAPKTYPAWNHIFEYALLCLRELLFGLAMGFVMTTMFDLVLTAGSIMDTQIGFSMINIYDVQSNTQSPISGTLFQIMLIVLFFGMDGHLRIIDILYATVEKIPVGSAMMSADIMWVAAKVMSQSFSMSLMMAMPVVASGILVELAMGAIIRTVPQMNMFVVGIPVKIIVGLIVLAGTFTLFTDLSKEITAQTFSYIDQMFAYFGSAA